MIHFAHHMVHALSLDLTRYMLHGAAPLMVLAMLEDLAEMHGKLVELETGVPS